MSTCRVSGRPVERIIEIAEIGRDGAVRGITVIAAAVVVVAAGVAVVVGVRPSEGPVEQAVVLRRDLGVGLIDGIAVRAEGSTSAGANKVPRSSSVRSQ